jgi:hypothetical protein
MSKLSWVDTGAFKALQLIAACIATDLMIGCSFANIEALCAWPSYVGLGYR